MHSRGDSPTFCEPHHGLWSFSSAVICACRLSMHQSRQDNSPACRTRGEKTERAGLGYVGSDVYVTHVVTGEPCLAASPRLSYSCSAATHARYRLRCKQLSNDCGLSSSLRIKRWAEQVYLRIWELANGHLRSRFVGNTC